MVLETLQNCIVEGNTVKLPPEQLDRKTYLEVKNKLELIGGKWKGGKTQGFVFNENPTELLQEIANGGTRNIKKEFQFFATPAKLADRLVELAMPYNNDKILEPSAGQGAIVEAIGRYCTEFVKVSCYELMPVNKSILQKNFMVDILGDDFLQAPENVKYNIIIANPPFAKNQDVDHIRKMYSVLENDGCIVTIASNHWRISSNKKETQFKEWLKEIDADIIDLEPGEFKESGTNISACIVVIKKLPF